MATMDYFEKITSVPVYPTDSIHPRMFLKIKYRTGIGYKKLVEGYLIRHEINPFNPKDIKMVLMVCGDRHDTEAKIPVNWIKSMERLVKVDPDYDIGI